MKKTKTMRIAVLMLALSLLTCCFVGSTFAKYTSEATGSSSVQVAKWEIYVNTDEELSVADPTISFDLFETILDSDGEAEDDVLPERIAPGTSGSFTLTITNNSDVNAKYWITFEETANALNVPVVYSTVAPAQAQSSDWKEIAELSILGENDNGTPIAMTDGAMTVTVYWMWDFDGDDTSIGIAAQEANTVEVSATVKVEQVD